MSLCHCLMSEYIMRRRTEPQRKCYRNLPLKIRCQPVCLVTHIYWFKSRSSIIGWKISIDLFYIVSRDPL